MLSLLESFKSLDKDELNLKIWPEINSFICFYIFFYESLFKRARYLEVFWSPLEDIFLCFNFANCTGYSSIGTKSMQNTSAYEEPRSSGKWLHENIGETGDINKSGNTKTSQNKFCPNIYLSKNNSHTYLKTKLLQHYGFIVSPRVLTNF